LRQCLHLLRYKIYVYVYVHGYVYVYVYVHVCVNVCIGSTCWSCSCQRASRSCS
jgi:hypothetical protein